VIHDYQNHVKETWELRKIMNGYQRKLEFITNRIEDLETKKTNEINFKLEFDVQTNADQSQIDELTVKKNAISSQIRDFDVHFNNLKQLKQEKYKEWRQSKADFAQKIQDQLELEQKKREEEFQRRADEAKKRDEERRKRQEAKFAEYQKKVQERKEREIERKQNEPKPFDLEIYHCESLLNYLDSLKGKAKK